MARFSYIARDRLGKKVSGVEEAQGQEELINRLRAKDLFVVNVNIEKAQADSANRGISADAPRDKSRLWHYGITSDDLVLFCRQMATLLGAGITILKSLDIIAQQVSSKKLYAVIMALEMDMKAGLSFHGAVARHPAVFSELWINLIESGEASGSLAMILNRLAGYLEKNAAFKSKLISALIYPAVLFVAGLGALLFLTLKIIPTFGELFKSFNVQLPKLTQILVNVSSFIRHYGLFILVLIVVGFFVLRGYIRTKKGRIEFEKFLFGLPVFGIFVKGIVMERFTSEMSTLVESGVPILYSLDIAERSVGNLTLGEIIHKLKDDVRDGKPLTEPLTQSGFFDPMLVQMVNVGEEIGQLPNMFKRLSAFYEEYVETFLARFTSLFEPIMLIFMGLVVGIMVVGMFLPIFQLTQIK